MLVWLVHCLMAVEMREKKKLDDIRVMVEREQMCRR